MAKTRVILVRHGETEWNIAMRLQGKQDSQLTEKGIKQAEAAAKVLQHERFHRLISSDLPRAVKTAEIINQYHGLDLESDASLRERNFGIMEGLTREEILKKYPETYHGYMQRRDTYQIPEGETLVDFFDRVTKGMNRIAEQSTGKRVVVVSHGGVLDCMMRMLFKLPLPSPRRFSIFNGSLNIFSWEGGKWELETWGYIPYQNTGSSPLQELR